MSRRLWPPGRSVGSRWPPLSLLRLGTKVATRAERAAPGSLFRCRDRGWDRPARAAPASSAAGAGAEVASPCLPRWPLFGFTKSNGLFVGRLALLGVAFSIIGEIITGKGALAQLNIETGVPINETEPLVLFNVLFFFIAAINPGTGKFIIGDDDKE